MACWQWEGGTVGSVWQRCGRARKEQVEEGRYRKAGKEERVWWGEGGGGVEG